MAALMRRLCANCYNTRSNLVRLANVRGICGNKDFSVTTPIFYVNAAPHIGHLYTALLADAACRWNALRGTNTKLVTGTDEHGMKIQLAAQTRGEPTLSYCDQVSGKFQEMFQAFGIQYTDYIRTTSQAHKTAVHHFWENLSSHLYKGSYAGWYCTSDEAFLTDSEVQPGKDSQGRQTMVSIESGQPCEWMEEENYMFPLSEFKDKLLHWLDGNVIKPSVFRSSLDASLNNLRDLSVSRSSERLSWGIPVPGDDTQTIYVWLDALVNYLTAFGYPDKMAGWPPTHHIVGKDILKFHAVYWPAFLMAAGLPLPESIVCHSHWLIDDRKMSKSVGNVVDPAALSSRVTADGLRYFLLREGVLSHDGNFSETKMVEYLNSELCNTLGNLLSRCTSKSINQSQTFPPVSQSMEELTDIPGWQSLHSSLRQLPEVVSDHYDKFHFYKGIDAIMAQLRATNGFLDVNKPWLLTNQEHLLSVVLHAAMENLRVCGILLQPIVPHLASNLLTCLGVSAIERDYGSLTPNGDSKTARRVNVTSPLYHRLNKS